MIIVCVGIPLLILVGYAHYKKTLAYKSETDVLIESNPYGRRDLVNSEISLQLDLKLISLILKMSNGEKIDKNEIAEVEKLSHEISKFVIERNFKNDLDIDFVKKQISKGSN